MLELNTSKHFFLLNLSHKKKTCTALWYSQRFQIHKENFLVCVWSDRYMSSNTHTHIPTYTNVWASFRYLSRMKKQNLLAVSLNNIDVWVSCYAAHQILFGYYDFIAFFLHFFHYLHFLNLFAHMLLIRKPEVFDLFSEIFLIYCIKHASNSNTKTLSQVETIWDGMNMARI